MTSTCNLSVALPCLALPADQEFVAGCTQPCRDDQHVQPTYASKSQQGHTLGRSDTARSSVWKRVLRPDGTVELVLEESAVEPAKTQVGTRA